MTAKDKVEGMTCSKCFSRMTKIDRDHYHCPRCGKTVRAQEQKGG